jgi:adenylate cyclase
LVRNLNKLFSIIDNLADKHGIEKIKTIGDSYMAVCGIPEHKQDHAIRMAEFAKEVMRLSESFNFEDRAIELRIGIHSGPAVAGVIGLNRYSYDLWGDSVNIASRLESTGMPGKIQVSESFVSELSNQSKGGFITSYRGETEMKGKGTMKTYTLL